MIHSRAAHYFDEVARLGSIRRAAETLRIAGSAINRQLLQLEDYVGAPLFERMPQGMRLTAAGELLLGVVRQTRRDVERVRSHIDDLQGLRRGRVTIASVEGATAFLSKSLGAFRERFPAIRFRLVQVSAQHVVDLVLSDECDFGVTINPGPNSNLRIGGTVAYRIGLVVPKGHPLARHQEIDLIECADLPLIVPDESLSLRAVVNTIWMKHFGELPFNIIEVSTIAAIKSLVKEGLGVALLTALDVMDEDERGELVYIPLRDEKIPLSVIALVTRSVRSLSVPASLLVNTVTASMSEQEGLPKS